MQEKQEHPQEDDTNTVSDTLEQLVRHYSQSIHKVEEKSPYFDSLLGYPPEISPVDKFHLEGLCSLPNDEKIFDWINGYVTAVRPCLLESSIGCVPVLQHYELVLSQWLSRHITANNQIISSSPTTAALDLVVSTIETLSSDITLLSSPSQITGFPPYVRSNIVLPFLLQILHQIIDVISRLNHCHRERLLFLEDQNYHQNWIIRCVVSLLAFDVVHLDPPTIAPSLVQLDSDRIEKLCACPPRHLLDDDDVKKKISKLLSLDLMDWTSVTLDSTAWNDPVTGIGSRMANLVWGGIQSLVSLSKSPNSDDIIGSMESRVVANQQQTKIERRRKVLRSLGMARMTQAVRSHFVGTDMHSWEPKMIVSSQVVMGRRVTKSKAAVNEKPYKSIPSRVHVALNFIRLIEREEDAVVSDNIVMNTLPICFELTDALNAVHVALGASALVHLLDTLGDNRQPVSNEQMQSALAILNRAFTTYREGPVMVVIGQAQSRLLAIIKEGDKERRKVSRQWISVLHQSAIRPLTDNICWELLVGAIIPLLDQHAALPDADCMELGRLGLSALLPLVAGEFVNLKTQVASMVALINLMVAAHPIMRYHGGKIMTHVLASAAAWTKEEEGESRCLRKITVHTAAVTLVICGGKFAGAILDGISSEKDKYRSDFLTVVSQVRLCAEDLVEGDAEE